MLASVIFDLDGLMIDSEPLQFRAYQQAFASFDFELTLPTWQAWHAIESSPRRWVEAAGLAIDVEAVRTRKKVIYDVMVEQELRLKPGVEVLVKELAADYPLCVASGSRRESINNCLEKFSLAGYFECVCSAADLPRSKPYPDVYLEALKLLGVDAGAALAIEDSPTGLRAAVAAGIACVVCPEPYLSIPTSAYSGALLMVESLAEIDAVGLAQLVGQRLTAI